MRLLNVHTLMFRVFPPKSVPSYVIASHRWLPGAEEQREATFQDVQDRKNTQTAGYQKIEAFADYIKAYITGVEWLWIDTCCINKQDAQELTEAINSMFKWYLSAVICLAYMADVSESADTDRFAQSEWFRRGWTLQELLAPRVVVFLSCNWQIIGHKGGVECQVGNPIAYMGAPLKLLIAEITRIPEAVLEDFRCSTGLTIEQRLRWMTGRETTREEDMWYCLFGIFDAPIGANYGEGGERARKRLLAEVRKDDEILARLPVASGAAFDDRENELVSECLSETRVDLLGGIDGWADQSDAPCIFWLSGVAGTGKSTVFKTAVQKFEDQGRLAASFCFKRGEGDRGHAGRLITTLSLQLARRLPDVRQAIISALAKEPDVVRKGLRIQFQKLMLKSLEQCASPPATGPAWIIGIDALDECDGESDIAIILEQLSGLSKLKSANFRLLVTSRPELPLQLGFREMSRDAHRNVRLEDVTEGVIKQDIAIYLRHRLAQVRDNYSNRVYNLGQDWPGEDAVEALAEMAQPLFIFAATVCRILSESGEDPRRSLRDVLARLLRMNGETVHSRLDRLHSVLEVPRVEEKLRPVRPLHLSFRDYLTAPETHEKTALWVDEKQTHRALALNCLDLLNQPKSLKQDMCSVKGPGTRRRLISAEHVAMHISADVAYASCNWVWHLTQGGEQLYDNSPAHEFLRSHVLHWLEALSWLDRLANAVAYITDLMSIVQSHDSSGITELLGDAKRFVLQNRYIIDTAPLQVYHAAMMVAPVQSIIRQNYEERVPRSWFLLPTPPERWNPEIIRFEEYIVGGFRALAFSCDGKTIASASDDGKIRLWDAQSGDQLQKFVGAFEDVRAVAISPDERVLVSVSAGAMVQLWDTQTGKQMQQSQALGNDIRFLALSPYGQITASTSEDDKLRLWNTCTGQQLHELEGCHAMVCAAAFSPDGHFVVSASDDQMIRVWSALTGEKMHGFAIADDIEVGPMALSPCRQVAVVSDVDHRVVLWNAWTGEQTREFTKSHDRKDSIAFSSDGKLIAVASVEGIVRLWDVRTGAPTHNFEGHTHLVSAVAFSPTRKIVASASQDHTIRLWDVQVDVPEQEVKQERLDREVSQVAFSPDGKVVASASFDGKVRLWDPQTGKQMLELKGHEAGVMAVGFSPDGQILASGSFDTHVESGIRIKNDSLLLWDTQTGGKKQRLNGNHRDVRALSFSWDGRVVASSSSGANNTVQLWDVRTGEQTHEFEAECDIACPAAFSPDGRLVAIMGEMGKATVRDVQNEGTLEFGKLHAHCHLLSFSPDGKAIASASFDGTVRLWDLGTDIQVRRVIDIADVTRITFSRDGGSLQIESGQSPLPPCSEGVCIRSANVCLVNGEWVRHFGEDTLWLPVEYRGPSAVYGRTLVIGQPSGAVSFYQYAMTDKVVCTCGNFNDDPA